jgi:hypothetical protein
MSSSVLPQELFDHIIDLLYYDKTTLRTCAIVCRAWRAHSQRHLFRSITIPTRERWQGFIALLEVSPQLGSFVKNLRIECQLNANDRLDSVRSILPDVSAISLCGRAGNMDIVKHLPCIRSVEICPTQRFSPFQCAYNSDAMDFALESLVFQGDDAAVMDLLMWLAHSDTAEKKSLRKASLTFGRKSRTLPSQSKRISEFLHAHPNLRILQLSLSGDLVQSLDSEYYS